VSRPKVTVLMSVYNGERFLRPAIESVLGQTFREFEFLIIDDGSSDASAAIVNGYKDPRIKLVHNAANIGLTRSLNRGLELALGVHIARMDCDDISEPGRLERQLAYLGEHPECAVVGCAYGVIDSQDRNRFSIYETDAHAFLAWSLCFQNPLAHPSVLMRADAVRAAGGYDTRRIYSQDYDLWWRLSRLGQLSSLPERLFKLRRHRESLTSRHLREQKETAGRIRAEHLGRLLGATGDLELHEQLESGDCESLGEDRVINRAREYFCQELRAGDGERLRIRRDAAARKVLLFLRNHAEAGASQVLRSALQLDPWVLLRVGGWPVSRFLLRRVRDPILYR
jgi:hypothetical protein